MRLPVCCCLLLLVAGIRGQDEDDFNLENAFGSEGIPKKPNPKPHPGGRDGDEFDLGDALGGDGADGQGQGEAVCIKPPELDFAVVEGEFIQQEFFHIGTSVQYQCRPGFVPITGKNNSVTCLSDLKWSQLELFCKQAPSCGDPEEIDHGQKQYENFLVGSRVTYSCNPGYSMISKINYRECRADGTWSGKPPVCKELVCDKLWELQEEARKCTSTPDEWIKYLQVQYLYLQIENMKLDNEIKKRQLGAPIQTNPISDEITQRNNKR